MGLDIHSFLRDRAPDPSVVSMTLIAPVPAKEGKSCISVPTFSGRSSRRTVKWPPSGGCCRYMPICLQRTRAGAFLRSVEVSGLMKSVHARDILLDLVFLKLGE